jgi:hypothetical protein
MMVEQKNGQMSGIENSYRVELKIPLRRHVYIYHIQHYMINYIPATLYVKNIRWIINPK